MFKGQMIRKFRYFLTFILCISSLPFGNQALAHRDQGLNLASFPQELRAIILSYLTYLDFLPIHLQSEILRFMSFYEFSTVTSMRSSIDPFSTTPFDREALQLDFDRRIGTFVKIPGGTFLMGSPESEAHRNPILETQHEITLTEFEIMDSEITQEAYVMIMGNNPSYFRRLYYCPQRHQRVQLNGEAIEFCPRHPVESLSWNDAQQFISRINQLSERFHYDLPTEAQSEYAIRGGTTTAYIWGEEASAPQDYVWRTEQTALIRDRFRTHPVRTKNPNNYGIFRGSVSEWLKDWHAPYPVDFQDGPLMTIDPQGPVSGAQKAIADGHLAGNRSRRGHFPSAATYPAFRSAYREFRNPEFQNSALGFRLVRTRRPN